MNIKAEEQLMVTVWNRCKKHFRNNPTSKRPHSWEQADDDALRDLDEYFHGSSYRFAMLLALTQKHAKKNAKDLDAGAGHGALALGLKESGYDAFASDLHKGLAVFDAEGIPYYEWHLEAQAAPFADNSFDVVILSQTIEHFTYSPLHPLKEIIRILRPGGIMIIDAPNITCFHNISRLLRGKSLHWNFKKHYLTQVPEIANGIPYYDRHNHEYSREDLQDIGDFFNLEIKDLAYYSSCNRQKRGTISIFIAQIRDVIKHWRKGIYAIYRLPIDGKPSK
ncbi:MAG: class I SAM-dependent methyltransferase [Mariprofundaceae bacterium]|nr:class I SAM-dependent methyltransferase [Mariprofundaceae bacterium]